MQHVRRLGTFCLLIVALLSFLSIHGAGGQGATTITVLGVVTTQSTESYVNQYTVAMSSQSTTQTGFTIQLTLIQSPGSACAFASYPIHTTAAGEYTFDIQSNTQLELYRLTADQASTWLSESPVSCTPPAGFLDIFGRPLTPFQVNVNGGYLMGIPKGDYVLLFVNPQPNVPAQVRVANQNLCALQYPTEPAKCENAPNIVVTTMALTPILAQTTAAFRFNQTLTETFTETLPLATTAPVNSGIIPPVLGVVLIVILLAYMLLRRRKKT